MLTPVTADACWLYGNAGTGQAGFAGRDPYGRYPGEEQYSRLGYAHQKYLSSRSSIQVGAIVEIPIGKKGLFFQPAILYTGRGRQYSRNYDTLASSLDSIYSKQNLSLNYIDIQMNFTYKVFFSRNHRSDFSSAQAPT